MTNSITQQEQNTRSTEYAKYPQSTRSTKNHRQLVLEEKTDLEQEETKLLTKALTDDVETNNKQRPAAL